MYSDECPSGYFVELAENMGSSFKEQNKSTIEYNVVQPHMSRRTKYLEKVKLRSDVGLPQNDLHHKTRQDAYDVAGVQEKFSGSRYRQGMKGNAAKVDELVKHMSNLPGYLQRSERGENIKEKVLNVGVLDWGRLEKWKHKQKHAPEKVSNSLSRRTIRTNAEEVSSRCSSLKAAQKDGLPQGLKPSVHKDVRFQDSRTASKNTIDGQKKISFTYMSLDKGKGKVSDQKFTSEMGNAAANLKIDGVSLRQKEEVRSSWDGQAKITRGLPESDIKRKSTDRRIIPEMGAPSFTSGSNDVSLSSKEKTVACTGKTEKKVMELHRSDTKLAYQHCHVEKNTVVPSPPEGPQLSTPRASWDECMTEANLSFSGEFSTSSQLPSEFCYEVPHSCPLPRVFETNTVSNETQDHLLYEDKFVQKNSSEKKLSRLSFDTSRPSDQEDVELETKRGRNQTPNRRFNFSLGRLGRSFSFKESLDVPPLSSTYVTAKSGPVRSGTSDCPDSSNGEKTSIHNRAWSSPLRRLLDPILKHKEANQHHSAEPVRPLKENSNSFISRPLNASDSLLKEDIEKAETETSWVQGVLQLTIKNGLPLFKFWVENNNNCLAATMKSLPSGKDDDLDQYFTFYSVNEMKRKSGGWMNQGSKGKVCRYVYNVVGQMKISSSDSSDVDGQFSKYMVRESVLLGVELTQPGQESSNFVLNREFAAAVIKTPRIDLGNAEQKSDEDRCSYRWEDSSIVILPGGVHSSPNKGEPSPLISRWKSGGLCDCGGWDIGCKLRVLSNENKCCQNPKSSTFYPFSDHYELYAEEGGAQQNKPVFSLTAEKDGSYSIEFNTTLSLLQAFYICVVVISSRKPSDLSDIKVFKDPNLNENSGIPVTGPSKYAPNPPLSPVGRV